MGNAAADKGRDEAHLSCIRPMVAVVQIRFLALFTKIGQQRQAAEQKVDPLRQRPCFTAQHKEAQKNQISLSQGNPARPLNLVQSNVKTGERTSSDFPISSGFRARSYLKYRKPSPVAISEESLPGYVR